MLLLVDEAIKDIIRKKLIDHVEQEASKPWIKILSLDGGGVRGILTIRVLRHLIADVDKLVPESVKPAEPEPTAANDEIEMKNQRKFMSKFQYIAGTSTGGLLAFALRMDVPLGDVEALYRDSDKFFVPTPAKQSTWLVRLLERAASCFTGVPVKKNFHWDRAKFDPEEIHLQIDRIVDSVLPGDDQTIGDLHAKLNPEGTDPGNLRCLVINTFMAADNRVLLVDSSQEEHKNLLVKVVLKGTMAAPYYFPPYASQTPDTYIGTYIDGGIFANDPMLTGLHCARMNGRLSSDYSEYRLVGIGTGVSKPNNEKSLGGGVSTWAMGEPKGLLLNTVLEANRSLTETISEGLARFQRIRRIKFNIALVKPPELDDFDFVKDLDAKDVWEKIKESDDMQALQQFIKYQLGGCECDAAESREG